MPLFLFNMTSTTVLLKSVQKHLKTQSALTFAIIMTEQNQSANMSLLGDLKTDVDVHKTVKDSIGYSNMPQQQKDVVDKRLKKLGAITMENMYYCLAPGNAQKPLVVDCRNPADTNGMLDYVVVSFED